MEGVGRSRVIALTYDRLVGAVLLIIAVVVISMLMAIFSINDI